MKRNKLADPTPPSKSASSSNTPPAIPSPSALSDGAKLRAATAIANIEARLAGGYPPMPDILDRLTDPLLRAEYIASAEAVLEAVGYAELYVALEDCIDTMALREESNAETYAASILKARAALAKARGETDAG